MKAYGRCFLAVLILLGEAAAPVVARDVDAPQRDPKSWPSNLPPNQAEAFIDRNALGAFFDDALV